MTLLIITYLIGYALSVILGRKYFKMGRESDLDISIFTTVILYSLFSWVCVIAAIIRILTDNKINDKPAPKWFR